MELAREVASILIETPHKKGKFGCYVLGASPFKNKSLFQGFESLMSFNEHILTYEAKRVFYFLLLNSLHGT
jgi:hypothetical protein